jgi:hypothetical protein
LTLLVLVAWVIAEDPGPILWITKSVTEAKKLMKTRLKPMLEMCVPVKEKMPTDKSLNTLLEIYFPGASLILAGSESAASLQSTPYRYVIMDEARSYPKGAVEMASKRVRSFTHSSKRIIISTPSKEKDVVDRNYRAGDMREPFMVCPDCGDDHKLDWCVKKEKGEGYAKGGLNWDKVLDENKKYDFDKTLDSVRYECWNPECEKVWRDEMFDRKWISRNSHWVAGNPSAPKTARSFAWNALLPWWPSWKDQVREFIEATAALEFGDWHPLKDHFNETRGEDWTDRKRFGSDEDEAALKARACAYDPMAKIDWEIRRFMTVDVQGKGGRHFKYVIRAWGHHGQSRLIAYGTTWSIEEIRSMQELHKVHPDNVALDSGAYSSEIYGYIVDSGYHWKALKGDDKYFFTEKGVKRFYTESSADPAIGTSQEGRVKLIPLYMWATYGAIDRLFSYMNGSLGRWEVFNDIDEPEHEGYVLEVTAKGYRDKENATGKVLQQIYNKRVDDHWCDCEQMQIVCADASGLFQQFELGESAVAKSSAPVADAPGVFDEVEDRY